jgi:hypothetical protein
LINENFTLSSNLNTFKSEKLIKDKMNDGVILTHFDQIKPFNSMRLTFEAMRIQTTPNAGGSSVESETLSFEVLKKYYNAKLVKTEMEVTYWPEGGSITDYVTSIYDLIIGVSVTRAMKYCGDELFTIEDANHLLYKKLKGIRQSSRNSMIKWDKQILHIWIMNDNVCEIILKAWSNIDSNIKNNTLLLITLARKSKEIFINPQKEQKNNIKKLKQLKDMNYTIL